MKKIITIKGINVKNGTSKQGKEWTRYSFYDGEQWFNMWAEGWNAGLQNAVEGDTVEIHFEKKDYHGKTQYEIVNPHTPEIVEEEKKEGVIIELKKAIQKLTNRIEIVEAQIEEQTEFPDGNEEKSNGTGNGSE